MQLNSEVPGFQSDARNMTTLPGWIGVDLDGTLAEFIGDMSFIGEPVLPMLNRVKSWIANGREVRIFTARAGDEASCEQIRLWLKKLGLPELAITDRKDFAMVSLWDDRAVQVIRNTGEVLMPKYDMREYLREYYDHWEALGLSREQIRAGTENPQLPPACVKFREEIEREGCPPPV